MICAASFVRWGQCPSITSSEWGPQRNDRSASRISLLGLILRPILDLFLGCIDISAHIRIAFCRQDRQFVKADRYPAPQRSSP
jgi:hypothetical protein